jgi:hypothetical protein
MDLSVAGNLGFQPTIAVHSLLKRRCIASSIRAPEMRLRAIRGRLSHTRGCGGGSTRSICIDILAMSRPSSLRPKSRFDLKAAFSSACFEKGC